LIRYTGNPHDCTKPLRAAILSYLGIKDEIFEKYPYWDDRYQKVCWHQGFITADDTELKLMRNPNKTYEKFFKNTKYDTMPKTIKFADHEWKNHLFSLKVIICNLCSIILNQRMTDVLSRFDNQEKKEYR
jgi:hypothetical protein